jgi:hypothetical protein
MVARPLTSLYKVFRELNPQSNEYKHKREALLALLNDDKADDIEDLEYLIKHAFKQKDEEILINTLKSIIKHNQVLSEELTAKLLKKMERSWFAELAKTHPDIQKFLERLKLVKVFQKVEVADSKEISTPRSKASSSSSTTKPKTKAPNPEDKYPLTVLFRGLKELIEQPNYDKSVYNNYRKALLALLKDDIPDSNEDLGHLFQLAKDTKDFEIIDAIISPFLYQPIVYNPNSKNKLLEHIINTFLELQQTPWFVSYFTSTPYQRKIGQILDLAFETHSASLSNEQLKKLLKMACGQNDFKLVANLLASPPADEIRDSDDEHSEDHLRNVRTQLAFEILEAKINDCYAQYTTNKKCLFWLVAIKDIIDNDELLNFGEIDLQKIKDLAGLALAHNNIQFVETWIKARPDLLDDQEFKKRAIEKYTKALKNLLEDDNARNGYGMSSILSILASDVMKEQKLQGLFPDEKKLHRILANTDPTWRIKISTELQKKGAIKSLPKEDLKDEELINFCLDGNVDEIQKRIANNFDFSKIQFNGNSILHYVVSYRFNNDKNGWPNSVLKLPLDEQQKDNSFKILSEKKNRILKALLLSKQFSKKDIQDAFNKANRDGTVKRDKEDKSIKTKFVLRGDHQMMRQLIDAGANPAIGETVTGIFRAITYSYAASAGLDFVLGTATDLIQHYAKVPVANWYKRFASYISGGTSAATFLATGAVAEAYHRNMNPDYYNNNFLDLTQVIVAGNYKRNWYGGVQSGRSLASSTSKQAGIIGSENAIFDANDITTYNLNIHHKVAMDVYEDYVRAQKDKENAKWYFYKNGLTGLVKALEEINQKCVYGIAGDNEYSFNSEFQEELKKLLSDENKDRTIDSIICSKRNQDFFLDLARGVDQGLVKVPLEMKRRILNARTIVLEKIEKQINIVPDRDLPYFFGKLRRIYDSHSKESVPLSVMLVAQYYKQLKISKGERELTISEKAWIGFVHKWQNFIGWFAPVFGLSKDTANDLIANSLQVSTAGIIGTMGYYEKKLRDEMIERGLTKSVRDFMLVCGSAMTTLDYAGIPPLAVLPALGGLLAVLYFRHKDINPFIESYNFANKVYASVVPTPDPNGIFSNKSTRQQFENLYKSINQKLIPEVIGMSL